MYLLPLPVECQSHEEEDFLCSNLDGFALLSSFAENVKIVVGVKWREGISKFSRVKLRYCVDVLQIPHHLWVFTSLTQTACSNSEIPLRRSLQLSSYSSTKAPVSVRRPLAVNQPSPSVTFPNAFFYENMMLPEGWGIYVDLVFIDRTEEHQHVVQSQIERTKNKERTV